MPTIDLSSPSKLYYQHIHKAYGLVFHDFLKRLPGVSNCDHLIAPNQVDPADWRAFATWWADPQPNCTLVSLEEPKMGELFSQLGLRSKPASRATEPVAEPQLLTLLRDPVARCHSHWSYDQKLCRSAFGRANSGG